MLVETSVESAHWSPGILAVMMMGLQDLSHCKPAENVEMCQDKYQCLKVTDGKYYHSQQQQQEKPGKPGKEPRATREEAAEEIGELTLEVVGTLEVEQRKGSSRRKQGNPSAML